MNENINIVENNEVQFKAKLPSSDTDRKSENNREMQNWTKLIAVSNPLFYIQPCVTT